MGEPVYPNNSHRFKEQQKEAAADAATAEKRAQKVVKSPVQVKTNEMRKLADIFITEDVSSVKNYIFVDVLVPAIKKAIYDIVTNGIDMFLYGSNGRPKTSGPSGTKVSYNNFYDQKNSSQSRSNPDSNKVNNWTNYDDIVFTNRGDAEVVLQNLKESVAKYRVVTVSELYDLVDQTAPYTAHKYGWMNLDSAEVVRVRGNYIIKLPRAVPID